MQMGSFASLGLVTLGAVETLGHSKIPRRTLNIEPDLLLAGFFFFDQFLIGYVWGEELLTISKVLQFKQERIDSVASEFVLGRRDLPY